MVWIRFLAGTNSGCSFSVDSYHTRAFSNSSCEGQRDRRERDTSLWLSMYRDFFLLEKHLCARSILQCFLNGSTSLMVELRGLEGNITPKAQYHKGKEGRAQEPKGKGRLTLQRSDPTVRANIAEYQPHARHCAGCFMKTI